MYVIPAKSEGGRGRERGGGGVRWTNRLSSCGVVLSRICMHVCMDKLFGNMTTIVKKEID